jgi:uncharacterized Zn finger protein (UPF0148 family)
MSVAGDAMMKCDHGVVCRDIHSTNVTHGRASGFHWTHPHCVSCGFNISTDRLDGNVVCPTCRALTAPDKMAEHRATQHLT